MNFGKSKKDSLSSLGCISMDAIHAFRPYYLPSKQSTKARTNTDLYSLMLKCLAKRHRNENNKMLLDKIKTPIKYVA